MYAANLSSLNWIVEKQKKIDELIEKLLMANIRINRRLLHRWILSVSTQEFKYLPKQKCQKIYFYFVILPDPESRLFHAKVLIHTDLFTLIFKINRFGVENTIDRS